MKNIKPQLTQSLAASLLILIGNLALADELPFPTTEAEIVKALTPKPKSTLPSTTKGLGDIGDDVPKAGALIGFEINSAVIKKEFYPLIHEFAKALQGGLADAVLEIAGHADSQGPEDFNLELSKRRAQAVKDFLVFAYDIAAKRLISTGYGEAKPIDSNDNEKGRLKNRRVEFIRISSE
jgi:outer membrane protein OmpA-like peptidoglycan-associated protein